MVNKNLIRIADRLGKDVLSLLGMDMIHDDLKELSMKMIAAGFPDAIYVNLNLLESGKYVDPIKNPGKRDMRTDFQGLDIALENMDRYVPLVTYSLLTAQHIFPRPKFRKIMSSSKSHFVRLPFDKETVEDVLDSPSFDNPALNIVYYRNGRNENWRNLRKEYEYRKNDTGSLDLESLFRRARDLGLEGTDEEIAEKIESMEVYDPRKDPAGELPGVFCDLDCLRDNHGNFNERIFDELIEESRENPVTLWTEKDPTKEYDIAKTMEKYELLYNMRNPNRKSFLRFRTPILGIQELVNSEPAIVIGRAEESELIDNYDIKPREYIRE